MFNLIISKGTKLIILEAISQRELEGLRNQLVELLKPKANESSFVTITTNHLNLQVIPVVKKEEL